MNVRFSRITAPAIRIIFLGFALVLAALSAAALFFVLTYHTASYVHLAHDKPEALVAIYGLILALGCGALSVITFIYGVIIPDEIWLVDENGAEITSRFLKYERKMTWPLSRLGHVNLTKKSGIKDYWSGYIALKSGGRLKLPIIRDETIVLQLEKILSL